MRDGSLDHDGFCVSFLRQQLVNRFGLVRALFFDKPPDRTWNIAVILR